MRRKTMISALMLGACAVALQPAAAAGQSWSAEQQEVWEVVQAQWKAAMEKDGTWMGRYLHEGFVGWMSADPAPRAKESATRWAEYEMENTSVLVQELAPLRIAVQGNTAVAHYYFSQAERDREGRHRTVHGRYSDVLVKENGQWRFLSWSGGAAGGGE